MVTSSWDVDAIIPTYNNVRQLEICLASLERQAGVRLRALVCVDGSTDGTREFLASRASNIPVESLVHPDGGNQGRAATRNLALPRLASEYVLLVDSDMEMEPDAVPRHLELAAARGCVSVGGIRYRNAQANLWARYLSTRGRNRWPDKAALPFTQFTTANALIRTADMVLLGGFDEAFTAYGGEDIEFAYRLQQRTGAEFIHNRRAVADTSEDKPLGVALQQFRRYGATNLRLLQTLHPDMPPTFHLDRLSSRSLRDRLFMWTMNPLTDALVGTLLPVSPFAVQRQLINYQVVRAVMQGYGESIPQRCGATTPEAGDHA